MQAPDDPTPDPEGIARTLDRMAEELGSPVPVRKVAEAWLAELPERLDGLQVAAWARDPDSLREGAHTLKSTSALVGAHATAKLASPRDEVGRDRVATLNPGEH